MNKKSIIGIGMACLTVGTVLAGCGASSNNASGAAANTKMQYVMYVGTKSADELIEALNQSTILIEKNPVEIEYYSGK